MKAYTVVVAAGLGSYLFRTSMLVVAARRGLPAVLERSARYAVPTAFAALATGSLVSRVGGHAAVASVAPLSAIAIAVIAVRRTGSPYAALLTGMPVLWIVTALVAR